MPDKSWKRNEREVAKDLNTKRNWKGTSGDIADIKDEHLAVEVKVGKGVPKYIYKVLEQAESHAEDRIAVGAVRRKHKPKRVAILDWEDFLKIYNVYKNNN